MLFQAASAARCGAAKIEAGRHTSRKRSNSIHRAANGLSLTRDDLSSSYAIIRHNVRTYRSAGVVEVIRGKQNAEAALKMLESCQMSADHHEGWRYFIEKTDMKAGTPPVEATDLRQANLEARELRTLEDSSPFLPPARRDK